MEAFSKIASWVFLPLFMPVFAMAAVMFIPSGYAFEELRTISMYTLDGTEKIIIIVFYFIFCVALPGLSFVVMRFSGIVSTTEMDDRKERWLPMATTILYSGMLYYFMISRYGDTIVPKYPVNLALSGVLVSLC